MMERVVIGLSGVVILILATAAFDSYWIGATSGVIAMGFIHYLDQL
jgi:hypothetical protein